MPVRTLTEAADLTLDPRGSGHLLVKIIDVGEGSSAQYTEAALRDAAARRVIPAGTHMYLDHADGRRRGPHGERSIRDLASVTTIDAVYDPQARALVAEAQALDGFEGTLEALAPHTGLSINATAEVDPPARAGGKPVVRNFLSVESVDWVVKAGRGGQVLAILESAGVAEATVNDRREQIDVAVAAAYRDPDRGIWVSLADFDESTLTAYFHVGRDLYAQTYEVADGDLAVSLTGERTPVRAITTYVPVASTAGVTETDHEEGHMPTIDQAELDRLHAQETQFADAIKRAEEAEARIAEADKAANIAEARKAAALKVAEATKDLPDTVSARITQTIEAQVGETLPDSIDADITAAVEAERKYLASVTESQRLTGFGPEAPEQPTTASTIWDK